MTRLIKSSPYSGAKSLRSGTRTFTCAKVLLWCGTTLGAIALCLWVAVSGAKLRMTHHPLYLSPCPACASDPSESTPTTPLDAIGYICTGTGCNVQLLCTSIRALRNAGGWSGAVYVVTDVEETVQLGCNLEFSTVPVPEVKQQMLMKNMKRNLLSILPGPPTAALYLDADVIPVGCVRGFLDTIAAGPDGPPELAFFRDNYCLGCNVYNGGFVYQRDTPRTRQCLAAWEAESSAENFTRYVKDQNALDQVLKNGECDGIRRLPSSAVAYVDSALWPAWLRIALTEPVFLHFTTGVRLGNSWTKIQSAMDAQLHIMDTELSNLRRAACPPPLD